MLTYSEQSKRFYEDLQMSPAIDLRDNRGKRHDLGLILLGVMLGLLRKRDGVLSSIHRSMCSTHAALCEALGINNTGVVPVLNYRWCLRKSPVRPFQLYYFLISELS